MAEDTLLAGSHSVDITPPAGVHAGSWMLHTALAEGAHDPLEVTALALSAGGRTVALVGVDVCMVDEATAREARRRIALLTGIPAEAVLFNASHNHAGPPFGQGLVEVGIEGDELDQWRLTLPSRIAGAVFGAVRRLEPATVGFGIGRAPGVCVNRVDRELSLDDSVWVMRIDDLAGTPKAVAVAFACHPITIGGQTRLWDADFPAPLRSRVKAELGVADCLFLQGAAGDIAPWDFWFGNTAPRPHSYETRDALADALADVVVAVAGGISPEPGPTRLLASSTTLELERRSMPWPAAEVAARATAHVPTPDEDYPEVWAPEVHTTTSAQQFPDYYQKHALALYRSFSERAGIPVSAEIQAIAINDHVLIANPFEPFTDVGRAIVAGSPFTDTRVLGYTNGYSGYLPPPADYAKIDGWSLDRILDQDQARWAYGITTAFVGPESSAEVIAESIAALEELAGE